MKHQIFKSKPLPESWGNRECRAESIDDAISMLMYGEIITLFDGEQRFSMTEVISTLECSSPTIIQEAVQCMVFGRLPSDDAMKAVNDAAERVAEELIDYVIQDAEEKAKAV